MSRFANGGEDPGVFSERKLLSLGDDPPWGLEELVAAQRMECAGASIDEIAIELGRSSADVADKLKPAEARPPARQERANVGFSSMKGLR